VATALVGKGPWRAAVDETSGRAFVLNRFDNTVSVLDVRRGRVVNTTYAYQPSALVVDTAANRIIVAGGSQLTVLDATTGDLMTAPTAACDQPLALDSQTARLFCPSGSLHYGYLQVLNAETLNPITTMALIDPVPSAAGVDRLTKRVFIVSNPNDSLCCGHVSTFDAVTGDLQGTADNRRGQEAAVKTAGQTA